MYVADVHHQLEPAVAVWLIDRVKFYVPLDTE